MQRPFRVVVIDDKPTACQRVASKLTGALSPSSPAEDAVLSSVEVLVSLRRAPPTAAHAWTFDQQIVAALDAATQHAPDLVVIDHFYVDSEVAAALKQKALVSGVTADELRRNSLSPADLRRWIENSLSIDSGLRGQILERLFNAQCPVYLHSYTPRGFEGVAGTIEDRGRTLATVFPHARHSVIDTRREFYNDAEFDAKYDGDYYAFQLAAHVMKVAEIEVLRQRVDAARYLRLRRTASSVAGIAVIGAAIGFAAGWLGDVFGALVKDGQYSVAAAVGIGGLVVLILLGTACPFLFEHLMHQLVRNERTA